jgi:hypothetical protein
MQAVGQRKLGRTLRSDGGLGANAAGGDRQRQEDRGGDGNGEAGWGHHDLSGAHSAKPGIDFCGKDTCKLLNDSASA